MTKAVLLLLAIFLFAVTTPPSPAAASAAPDPVLDMDGKELRVGVGYYILPVYRGLGGGLTLASTRNKTCPFDVVQEIHDVSKGLPATFAPANQTKGVVRVSTDLNIKFSATTTCGQSTVWKLDRLDAAARQWFVTSGGVEGNPGQETTSNWFKIEKYDRYYKLIFCPTVCKSCKVLCKDVGIYIEKFRRRLALSDEPFMVRFKRA